MTTIAISGSQGSGKSTLISALQKQGFAVVERKTSRSILSDWGVTLREVNSNPALTTKFQDEILSRKLADDTSSTNQTVITERSFVDLFTYALIALGKDNQYSRWLEQYYTRCCEAQRMYKAVVYLTAGHFNVEHDGVRGSGLHYSRMVDVVMRDYGSSMTSSAVWYELDEPNIDTRVKFVKQLLARHQG